MNYIAKAKIDTPVFELPGGNGNKLKIIKKEEQFKIIDSKHIGLKTYYKIDPEGYIFSSDAIILRDSDFFYQNYSSKKLIKRSLTAAGNSLGSVLGETNDITTNYEWLVKNSYISKNVTFNSATRILDLIENSFDDFDQVLLPNSLKSSLSSLRSMVNKYKNNRQKLSCMTLIRLYNLRNDIIDFIEDKNIDDSIEGANDLNDVVNSIANYIELDDMYILPKKENKSKFKYDSYKVVLDATSEFFDHLPEGAHFKESKKYYSKLAYYTREAKNKKANSKSAINAKANLKTMKAALIKETETNKITKDSPGALDIIYTINRINDALNIKERFELPETYDPPVENPFDADEAYDTLSDLGDSMLELPQNKIDNNLQSYYDECYDLILNATGKDENSKEARLAKRALIVLQKKIEYYKNPKDEIYTAKETNVKLAQLANTLEEEPDENDSIVDDELTEAVESYIQEIQRIRYEKKRANRPVREHLDRLEIIHSKIEAMLLRKLQQLMKRKMKLDRIHQGIESGTGSEERAKKELKSGLNFIKKLINALKEFFDELIKPLQKVIELLEEAEKWIINNIIKPIENAVNSINSLVNVIDDSIGKINNLFNDIFGWIFDKLSYVIGFSQMSLLSALFQLFGLNFETIIGVTLNSLFGGKVNTFLTPMDDFFNYKTVNGQKIWYNSSSGSWSSNIKIHRTGPIESEMKVWKKLAEADYSEVKDAITAIKQELNLDVGENKTKNIYTKFNRFRLAIPDHELNGSVGHIFFIRPDLNLTGGRRLSRADFGPKNLGSDEPNPEYPNVNYAQGFAHYTRLFMNLVNSNPTLAQHLSKNGFSGHNFMPLLTHACIGIDVADEVLETVETGETFVGWKYVYGTSMIKSKTAGTINVQFADDNILSVYKLIKVWTEYIHAVRHGEIFPKDEYVMKHQLDYPTSIYYILTDNTGEAILFWTKYTGAFPVSTPSSNFSDSLGNRITRPNYSVQFAYSRKDDFNPLHLEELNRQSSETFAYNPIYNKDTMRTNRTFVGPPFVDTTDGELTYRLRFRPASTT